MIYWPRQQVKTYDFYGWSYKAELFVFERFAINNHPFYANVLSIILN